MFSKRSLFDFDLNSMPDYAQKYGLLFPGSINSAIDVLAKHNYLDSEWGSSSLRDIMCYYLFYLTIVAQQSTSDAYGFYPFRHISKSFHNMGVKYQCSNLQILLAGCSCEETALCGYEAVEKMFDVENINLFRVIDLCSMPIHRITKLTELQPFAKSLDFQTEVKSIQKESQSHRNSYDVIITDHLLGSSPKSDYDIMILNEFWTLLKDGGVVITTVAIYNNIVFQPHSKPGKASFDYFCNRYGQKPDGRDAKIGLTEKQWNLLGKYYDTIMSKTYFNLGNKRKWRLQNIRYLQDLFLKVGFHEVQLQIVNLKDGTYEEIHTKDISEGLFVICGLK